MNNLYCIIGESGSGKTTIVNYLKGFDLKSIDSYTTRPPRKENEEGHIFVNQDEFDKIRHDLCAYTKFSGYEYGTTNNQIEECDLYVVDYAGYLYLKHNYKGNKKIISIYIDVPQSIRIERMENRNDTDEMIKQRINNDKIMFDGVADKCDYIVENSSKSFYFKAADDIIKIINENEDV